MEAPQPVAPRGSHPADADDCSSSVAQAGEVAMMADTDSRLASEDKAAAAAAAGVTSHAAPSPLPSLTSGQMPAHTASDCDESEQPLQSPLCRQLSYDGAGAEARSARPHSAPLPDDQRGVGKGDDAGPNVGRMSHIRVSSAFEAAALQSDSFGSNSPTPPRVPQLSPPTTPVHSSPSGSQSEAPPIRRSSSSGAAAAGVDEDLHLTHHQRVDRDPHLSHHQSAATSAAHQDASTIAGENVFAAADLEGFQSLLLRRNSGSGTVSPLAALSDGYHSPASGDELYCCEVCDVTTTTLSHLEVRISCSPPIALFLLKFCLCHSDLRPTAAVVANLLHNFC